MIAMRRISGPTALVASLAQLHGEARDVDAVARGVALVGGVRLLEKIGDVVQNMFVAEGQIFVQDREFFVPFRKIDQDLRLQAGVDVLGQIESAGVVVHGGHQAEQRMRLDLDSGDDGFDVAAIVEQRREARPAFLAHAVAFIENDDAAAQHGGHQRRGDIAQLRFALDHGRDSRSSGRVSTVACRM